MKSGGSGYLHELTNMEKSHMSEQKEDGFKGIWAKNAFLIITLVKKFVSNLKELSMRYKFG